MRRTSLGLSVAAPREREFSWASTTPTITSDGSYSPALVEMGTIKAAMIANFRVWPSRTGYGKWESFEAPLVAIRGEWEDGKCVFPEVRTTDTLTDSRGRVWEVISREEWEEAGLLVLTVRAAGGAP